jgi:hypothetical protein
MKQVRLTHIMLSGNEMPQSSTKHGSVKGKGWKRPANAIDPISFKKLEKRVKQHH